MFKNMLIMAVAAILLCGCFVVVRGGHGYRSSGTVIASHPTFNARPRLVPIPEANAFYAPDVAYDLFFYGNNWYWYSNGTWRISSTFNGPWQIIGSVPSVFYQIPSSHPKYYVINRRRERYEPGRPSWVSLRSKPRLVPIPEAGIYYASGITADLFFLGSTWYWYSDGLWYSSSSYNGPWISVSVMPASFERIPSSHPKYKVVKSRRSPTRKLRNESYPKATPAIPPPPASSRSSRGKSPVKKLRDKSIAPPPPAPSRTPSNTNRSSSPVNKLRGKSTPVKRVTPVKPTTPANSNPPSKPAKPVKTGKPVTPATPGKPGKPEWSATPANPGKPGTPATPATPASAKKNKEKEEKEEKEKKEKKTNNRRERGR